MKTLAQTTENIEVYRKTNKLLLAAGMIACITTGWLLGNLNPTTFSQASQEKDATPAYYDKGILLPSLSMNGETLPTIILSEISVVSNSN